MTRYNRAAAIGYSGAIDSPSVAPYWLRCSLACRAAFEIGAYLARCGDPLQAIDYAGGRKAPRFILADGRRLAVHSEYPGIWIRAFN